MRFDFLDIPAFGHFTDFSLEFSQKGNDLHLIYGPNEAGKSSLLCAIHDLFFGIDSKTPYNFLHKNSQLLIGAQISQGAESLHFFRRKGNKHTLLDESRNSLDDANLAPFLGSVNEDFFRNMFGLNTESLRVGARRLLAGDGDLGTAIFSASLGGSPIDETIKNLESEAHQLWKGATRSTTIYQAKLTFDEAESAAKKELTTTTAWRTLKADLKKAEQHFTEAETKHRSSRLRARFVENSLQAYPVIETVKRLKGELAELKAPELPTDFTPRVREIQAQITQRNQELQLHQAQMMSAQADLKAVPEFKHVLARSHDFESLHRKAEQYHEGGKDLPARQAQVTRLQVQLQEFSDFENLPSVTAGTQRVFQEMVKKIDQFETQKLAVKEILEKLEIEITARREELSQLSEGDDISALETMLEELEAHASVRKSLTRLQETVHELAEKCERLGAKLSVSRDPAELKVPGLKILQKEARQEERYLEDLRELENDLRELRDQEVEESTSLSSLRKQSEIYSLIDLKEARSQRDALAGGKGKTEMLMEAILLADQIADALRNHADHIAKASTHESNLAKLKSRRENRESDLAEVHENFTDWREKWAERCENLPAKSPHELLDWRQEWEQLCELTQQLAAAELEVSLIEKAEEKLLARFPEDSFTNLRQRLRKELKKATQEQGQQLELQKILAQNEMKRDQFKVELKALKESLAGAKKNWKQECKLVGISKKSSPVLALESITASLQVKSLRQELEEAEEDLKSHQASQGAYQSLLQSLADEFQGASSESALWKCYTASCADESRAQMLEERLATLTEQKALLELTLKTEKTTLGELQSQAGTDDLEVVIQQIERRHSLMTRLAEQETALQQFAGTTSLKEFIASVDAQDTEDLVEEQQELASLEDQLQRERDEAKAHRDLLIAQERELLRASDAVAAQKQAAQHSLATIVADAERFTQLHYAADFLKQQVESYRKKTQGPMIEKTSHFFHDLTGGAFGKVAAQLDDKGVPKLVALRKTGETVETSGLSEGTADQLYLALRLAAIDLHLENHAAMPLILDDLLQTFDDERTAFLLPVLEEMSTKTQVLIFTHHAHLSDLAKEVVPQIHCHSLA